MKYKQIVKAIRELKWENLPAEDLQKLMILAEYSAREFAESLRIALQIYPENEELQEMAHGEINTNNLKFKDYNGRGDHSHFLEYFIAKYKINQKVSSEVISAGDHYITEIRKLPKEVRAMSIFSREQELPGIFQRILQAKGWKAQGLPEFKYYLEQHILLDSSSGGHSDLVQDFLVDDRMEKFYKIRLEMYKSIVKLFNN